MAFVSVTFAIINSHYFPHISTQQMADHRPQEQELFRRLTDVTFIQSIVQQFLFLKTDQAFTLYRYQLRARLFNKPVVHLLLRTIVHDNNIVSITK
jgi:hypothetical protein